MKFKGLARTSSGVVHLFRDKYHLKTLCSFKIGTNEKITWGSLSRVNCNECQQILNEEKAKNKNQDNTTISADSTDNLIVYDYQ